MSEPIVVTEQGSLKGKIAKDINGKEYYSFQGIPYAKPPLGNLRFKAPEPAEPWTGVLDATKEGNKCYARNMIFRNVEGSEDCLFLNVFTSKLPSNSDKVSRPVMVWIHGGGFTGGSSSQEVYSPDYLMTEDIVLVTINYRLGILGFLSFDDDSLGVPGNAGLKDMVLALKWVQKNIAVFGANPGNVTIFGESAGGASVHYLALSPLTKGLFHKVIAQSGCALNPFAKGRKLATELAQILDLPNASEKEILKHLTDLPVEKLFEISEKVPDAIGSYQLRHYGPIIEKPSPDAFITEEPIEIINSGKFNKVPLIFGYTSREGMMFEILMQPAKPKMPDDFQRVIPHFLGIKYGSDMSRIFAEKIKNFYYGEGKAKEDIDNFYLLFSDSAFIRDIYLSVVRHSEITPVYFYRISVESNLNLFKKIGHITAHGVSHGDDIGYLFKTILNSELTPGSLEEISVRRFVKLWTNFAKNGDPNSEDLEVEWKPVKKNEINFIDIGEKLTVGVNPDSERMKFWEDVLSVNPKFKI